MILNQITRVLRHLSLTCFGFRDVTCSFLSGCNLKLIEGSLENLCLVLRLLFSDEIDKDQRVCVALGAKFFVLPEPS